jgi:hypothetical protein
MRGSCPACTLLQYDGYDTNTIGLHCTVLPINLASLRLSKQCVQALDRVW